MDKLNIPLLLTSAIFIIAGIILSGYTTFNSYYICTTSLSSCQSAITLLEPTTIEEKQWVNKQKRIDYYRQLSYVPKKITKKLGTSPLILGREDLFAFDTDKNHISLTRDDEAIYLQNISSASAVPITIDKINYYPRQHPLANNDQIQIGQVSISTQEISHNEWLYKVSATNSHHAYHVIAGKVVNFTQVQNQNDLYQFEKNAFDWQSVTSCDGNWLATQFAALKKRIRGVTNIIRLGGRQICGDNIPLPTIEKNSFVIIAKSNANIFKASKQKPYIYNNFSVKISPEQGTPFLLKNNSINLMEHLNLDDKFSLRLGYSNYEVKLTENSVIFDVSGNVIKQHIKQASKTGNSRALVTSGGMSIIFIGLFVTLLLLTPMLQQYPPLKRRILNGIIWAVFLLLEYYFLRNNVSAIAIVCWATMVMLVALTAKNKGPLLGITTFFVCLLLLVGIDYGLALNISPTKFSGNIEGDVNWFTMNKYFNDFAKQLSNVTYLLQIWILTLAIKPKLKFDFVAIIEHKFTKSAFIVIWAGLVFLQAIAGSETGIGGIQPNELVKLVLCLMTAIVIYPTLKTAQYDVNAFFQKGASATAKERIGYLLYESLTPGFYLAISILGLVSMVFVIHDFSYLIIVFSSSAFAGCYLIFHAAGISKKVQDTFDKIINSFSLSRYLIILLYLIIIGLLFFTFIQSLFIHMQNVPLEALQNYSDRVSAWLNPFANEQAAYQVMQSFELRASHRSELDLFLVPEIDDDFAITGWMSSNTILPKATIFFATASLIFCLAMVAANTIALNRANQQQWALEGGIFAGIGILFAHIVMAMSTNYNFLPVMGQPYPFLGRQGSFLLFFIIPFFILVTMFYPTNKEAHE